MIFPGLKYWHTATLTVVISLHLVYLFCRFTKEGLAVDVTKILCLVFGTLIAVNVVTSAPKIIEYAKAQRPHETDTNRSEKAVAVSQKNADEPTVYMFIFDEYANFPQMEEYYNYDNVPLKEFLSENNFIVSYTCNNDSVASVTVQTNLVNLDYIVDDTDSPSGKNNLRADGVLFSLFENHGYNVQIWEEGSFYGTRYHQSYDMIDTSSKSINGDTLQDICFANTIIYPLQKADGADSIEAFLRITDWFSSPESIPEEKTFSFIYFMFPHQPFVVDENGQRIALANRDDWGDNRWYLGQYKYATKLMISMLSNIIENDPEAIIILQSDHGARAADDLDLFLKKFPLDVMENSLNCLYYPANPDLSIEGLSLVNTLRALLNDMWGLDYEMLDVPQNVY